MKTSVIKYVESSALDSKWDYECPPLLKITSKAKGFLLELSVRWQLLYDGWSMKQHETLEFLFCNFLFFILHILYIEFSEGGIVKKTS